MFIVTDIEVTTLTRSYLCIFFSMIRLLHTKVLGMCANDKSSVIHFFLFLGDCYWVFPISYSSNSRSFSFSCSKKLVFLHRRNTRSQILAYKNWHQIMDNVSDTTVHIIFIETSFQIYIIQLLCVCVCVDCIREMEEYKPHF